MHYSPQRALGSALWALGLVCAASGALPAAAQAPPPGQVAVDPIRCWWRSSTTAIHVGERFTLTLTCALVEAGGVTVVPAFTQLDPAAVQLTPFEVVEGTRHDDVVVPPRRYIQYEYVARLLGEGFFGEDVNVPALTVTYNIQSASGASEGRDQGYMLPPLPMRVTSLVPRDASDIRDGTRQTFGAIESRRFRGTSALVGAGVFFGFAAVCLGVVAVRLAAGYRQARPERARPLPAMLVLGGCLRALGRARAEAASGEWTPELARRALAAVRVAAAVGLGHRLAQADVPPEAPAREGQIALRRGLLRPARVLVSAPLTPRTVAAHLADGRAMAAATRATLERLRHVMEELDRASYGRDGNVDRTALEAAIEEGTQAIRQLRVRTLRAPWRPVATGPAPAAVRRTSAAGGIQ